MRLILIISISVGIPNNNLDIRFNNIIISAFCDDHPGLFNTTLENTRPAYLNGKAP